jgi:alpha-beta hydrolase superfamily lysophospholipase
MRFTSQTSSDGVTERAFTLDEIPGVLWTPEGPCDTRPLILLGHGGGQHKTASNTASRARRYAAGGFAALAIDAPNHGDRWSRPPGRRSGTRVI